MSGAANALALYGRYLAMSVRAQLQYRAAFAMAAFGQFLVSGIEFIGVWALFDRFGSLQGWTFAEAAFFYGVVNCTFALADTLVTGFDRFGTDYVKTGDFDRLLLRPRSTVLQLAGAELALRRIGRLTQGLVVLGWASWALGVDWGFAQAGLLALTIAGGIAFFFALFVLQATLCFWTTETLEMMNVLTYGGVESSQYPMSIYQATFRRFFTFVVPLGCVSYFPIVAIIGADDPLGSGRVFQVLAPLAGFAFLGAALGAWRFGVSRYTSTGN